jgi:hypothetical protein
MKLQYNNEKLVRGLPDQFNQWLNHIRLLRYEDKPDYGSALSPFLLSKIITAFLFIFVQNLRFEGFLPPFLFFLRVSTLSITFPDFPIQTCCTIF